MEKVDILIGAVGVVALIATGLGVAFYEDGASDYMIGEGTVSFSAGAETTDASGTTFTFDAPDNAYGAMVDVEIGTTGFANPTDTVTVTVNLIAPSLDGEAGEVYTVTDSFAFQDGGITVHVHADDWVDVPEAFRGTEDEVAAHTTVWDGPFTVEVFVDGPGFNPLTIVPSQDAYTAAVSGTTLVYLISDEIPELETA